MKFSEFASQDVVQLLNLSQVESSDEVRSLKDYDDFLKFKVQCETGGDPKAKCDPTLKSISELISLAVECDQTDCTEDFVDKPKVLKVRIGLSRKEIEKVFGIKTVGVYGIGIFIPVEGIWLDEGFRSRSNYDKCILRTGRHFFDTSSLPEEIVKTHMPHLTVSAMRGVFMPKRSRLTEWVSSYRSLQYFDFNL